MFRCFIFTAFILLSTTVYAQTYDSQNNNQDNSINDKSKSIATISDILSGIEKVQQAEKSPSKTAPLFTGSAELGFLYKTGNTNSADIKTGFDLRFEKGNWLSLLNVDLLIKKSDVKDNETDETHFKTTDQKWTIASQTNYKLAGDKNYIYGNIWYEESEFNSFVNQSSISTGWGRHWYKTKKSSLWADIGPGYKRDLIKKTQTLEGKTEESWIIQAQVLYLTKLGEHVEFKQHFSAKQSLSTSDNSTYKAVSTVTTKLISTLQLKFTFTIDYNTEVKVGKENLDTQTAVTLVYSF